jgi:hypothetical protein
MTEEYRNPFQEILSGLPKPEEPWEEGHPDHEAFLEWTYEMCMGWTSQGFTEWLVQYKEDQDAVILIYPPPGEDNEDAD